MGLDRWEGCDEKVVSRAVSPLLPLERASHVGAGRGGWWGAERRWARTLPLPVPPRSSAGTPKHGTLQEGLKNQLYHTFSGSPFNSSTGLFYEKFK